MQPIHTLLAAVTPTPGVPNIIGHIDAGPVGGVTLGSLLAWVLNAFFILAAFVALVFMLIGAFNWVSSGGEEKKLEQARQTITNAALGLVITIVLFVGWTVLTGPILHIFKENGEISLPSIRSN